MSRRPRGDRGSVKLWLRVTALWEYLKGALWLMPALFVGAAVVLGSVLVRVSAAEGWSWIYAGSAEGARSLLAAVAGAMITVTGLTFSLTIVALQMASSQFSPRVLRGFMTDRGNQFVLSTLIATFAYCLAVLRAVRGGDGGDGGDVPRLAVTVAVLLSLVAVGALVYFLDHLSRQLRAQTILADVTRDTMRTIDRTHPDDDDPGVVPSGPPQDAYRVPALRSGYLQAVELRGLATAAAEADIVVYLRAPVGAHVTMGTTLAWIWPGGDGDRALDRVAHDHVHLGAERILQQDVAFGIRQLVDIGVKALSPGLNDPATAVDVLGHLSEIACALASRRLGAAVVADGDGHARAIVPGPEFRDYLALMCDQIRRYGSHEPAVLRALLATLTDVAEVATGDDRLAAVREEIVRTVEVAESKLDDTDAIPVRGAGELALQALDEDRRPDPVTLAQ